MSEFKVGDRVRLTGPSWGSYQGYDGKLVDPKGIYTVTEVCGGEVTAGNAGLIRDLDGGPYEGFEVEKVEKVEAPGAEGATYSVSGEFIRGAKAALTEEYGTSNEELWGDGLLDLYSVIAQELLRKVEASR